MYARVLPSASVSGGRGPNSICFLTWSIARSPLNSATTVGAGVFGRAVLETVARGRAGGSSFGQPINNSGAANTVILVNLANPVILSNKLSLRLRLPRFSSRLHLPSDRIKRLRPERERLLDRRIERFRHRDRFELH